MAAPVFEPGERAAEQPSLVVGFAVRAWQAVAEQAAQGEAVAEESSG